MKNLIGLDREELAGEMTAIGEKPFRAKQIWHWIYHQGVMDFAGMTNIAKPLRLRLAGLYDLSRPRIARSQVSGDGARKWLLRAATGEAFESVFIPEEDRGALCISSQVGCTLNCAFCHTGTQRMERNLSAGEIVGQMMVARDAYKEWPAPQQGRMLTNVVMMGMGEPLLNYDQVAKALRIIMDPEGLAISKRRVTLSTAGIAPMIGRVGAELGVGLAISLHAVTDELRDQLVPINRKYPIKELLAACRAYPGASNARRITFEYVMLRGLNDSPADARALARLLADLPAKINLIAFNEWPGAPYRASAPRVIRRFSEILNEQGLSAPIRVPRGRDIDAACGQLKSSVAEAVSV
jgi:23S rRNA (adenine2503-C2)-methyltransferase